MLQFISLIHSLESIKCINELLMKRLIPYSYRNVYNLIISTITSIIDVHSTSFISFRCFLNTPTTFP